MNKTIRVLDSVQIHRVYIVREYRQVHVEHSANGADQKRTDLFCD